MSGNVIPGFCGEGRIGAVNTYLVNACRKFRGHSEHHTLVRFGTRHEADRTFEMLMGEEVPPRKRFIQTHAKQVRNLDV